MQSPEGWPIVDRGLLMAYVDRVVVVHMNAALTPRAFERYLVEVVRAIDLRGRDARVGALYHVPMWPGTSASQRHAWGLALKSREDTLRRTTFGMAIASCSAVVRGASRAIFWFAPPPYPVEVADTTAEAFAFLARSAMLPDARACEAEYRALLAQHGFA